MLAVFDWMRKRGFCVWPLAPSEVILYMNKAVESQYESTRVRSLMEALRFCKHVVRLPDLDEVLDNPILTGKSKRMDAERQTIKQCRPLTVDEVRRLESFLYFREVRQTQDSFPSKDPSWPSRNMEHMKVMNLGSAAYGCDTPPLPVIFTHI